MSIPAFMHSSIGKIPVYRDRKTDKKLDKNSLMGSFTTGERVIRVHSSARSELAMSILGHETMHSILSDSGVTNVLDSKQEEAVCDAFGTWLAGAIQSGAVTLNDPNW
jgi:spore coat protein CotH